MFMIFLPKILINLTQIEEDFTSLEVVFHLNTAGKQQYNLKMHLTSTQPKLNFVENKNMILSMQP